MIKMTWFYSINEGSQQYGIITTIYTIGLLIEAFHVFLQRLILPLSNSYKMRKRLLDSLTAYKMGEELLSKILKIRD